MGRGINELGEKCLFICCKTVDEVGDVETRGVEVKASNCSSLGMCEWVAEYLV